VVVEGQTLVERRKLMDLKADQTAGYTQGQLKSAVEALKGRKKSHRRGLIGIWLIREKKPAVPSPAEVQ